MSFDENGDVLPIYDVMNWRWLPDGSTEVTNVGDVKEMAAKVIDLNLDEDKIFWNFESKKVCFPTIYCQGHDSFIIIGI